MSTAEKSGAMWLVMRRYYPIVYIQRVYLDVDATHIIQLCPLSVKKNLAELLARYQGQTSLSGWSKITLS